jgi:acetylcholinesterase
LLNSYGSGELKDYFIGFVNALDPNDQSGIVLQWPQYNLSNPLALVFEDNAIWPVVAAEDRYRREGIDLANGLAYIHPI